MSEVVRHTNALNLSMREPCNGCLISGNAPDGDVTYEIRRANGSGWHLSGSSLPVSFERWSLVRMFLIRLDVRDIEYLEF